MGATDGADEVDTIIKGGKQRGKQSEEFRLSIPAPFHFHGGGRHEFFGFASSAIKSGIVTISGPKERVGLAVDVVSEVGKLSQILPVEKSKHRPIQSDHRSRLAAPTLSHSK